MGARRRANLDRFGKSAEAPIGVRGPTLQPDKAKLLLEVAGGGEDDGVGALAVDGHFVGVPSAWVLVGT
jgi:hypothetical protein